MFFRTDVHVLLYLVAISEYVRPGGLLSYVVEPRTGSTALRRRNGSARQVSCLARYSVSLTCL
jgi:hypothetical protein